MTADTKVQPRRAALAALLKAVVAAELAGRGSATYQEAEDAYQRAKAAIDLLAATVDA